MSKASTAQGMPGDNPDCGAVDASAPVFATLPLETKDPEVDVEPDEKPPEPPPKEPDAKGLPDVAPEPVASPDVDADAPLEPLARPDDGAIVPLSVPLLCWIGTSFPPAHPASAAKERIADALVTRPRHAYRPDFMREIV
jgi:hypothetical protein